MTRAHSSGRRRGRQRTLSVLASMLLATAGVPALATSPLEAQSLRGSPAKLDLQNRVARQHDFTYLRNPEQVRSFVAQGLLVPVRSNADFDLHAVSFPYARPEAALFIQRLASQYRGACNEKLVVTSLTRPLSHQPPNASARSVHPTGMAIDLRVSSNSRCRSWLESALLQLARAGVLDAIRESRPPHYHVVVFPRQYGSYVDQLQTRVAQAPVSTPSSTSPPAAARSIAEVELQEYRVRRGDSLWVIARTHGTTVERLMAENDLRSNRIYAGQVLAVPTR